jgi:hypothetical protein
MKGIRYVVDDKGQKSAVLIDLKQHGELWEELYDGMTVVRRRRRTGETAEKP